MKRNLTTIMALMMGLCISAQTLPYQNPNLTPQERAEDLVGRLTIEEKARLMQDISQPVARLGIKKFNWWSEALHGVANQGGVTVFPQPIGMAASFNDAMLLDLFSMVSTEMRASYNRSMQQGKDDQRFHSLSVWTPNVNIFRDPRWGRGQETYGEDPYLMERMGVSVVKGLQGPEDTKYRKLYACAKHYAVHSGPEYSRHTDNITDVSARDLWETYLPAFKALVQTANVREVMCAYQRLDDDPCCGNSRILQQILRDEWGFKHLVVSDCGAVSDFWTSHKSSTDATHAAAKATLAGTDVECGYNYAYKSIPAAVKQGLIDEKEVDKHVVRLMKGRFELGEMDDPSLVEWSKIPASKLNCQEHKDMALNMALQTMTLLQNKNNILPLSKSVKKIALVGPNFSDEPLMWGNYNGTPNQTVSLWEGVQNKVGEKKLVSFRGCDYVNDQQLFSYYDQCKFDGKTGFKGTFWNNRNREGEPVATNQSTRPISVTTYGQYAFAPGVNLTGFSAKYETVFYPKKSEKVLIEVEGCSSFELFVNGESKQHQSTWRTTKTRTELDVEAGKEYKIEINYAQIENYDANLKVNIGKEMDIDYDAVLKDLKDCDIVIFAGGISSKYEGEEMPVDLPGFKGGDRTDIQLPAVQRTFLRKLHEAGKKVVLVNFSGSAMGLVPETETCDAILQAWYPGEMGGQAIADVLFGDYNPSGKLPITFYRDINQLPDYKDYAMKNRTYRYMTEKPLYPFGYGLSYTTFAIGNGKLSKSSIDADGEVTLTASVKNTGKRAGTEVVQVYIRNLQDPNGPKYSLRGFSRVELKAGETKDVKIQLSGESFEFFNEDTNTMTVRPGKYEVLYGSSSDEADLKKLEINVVE